MDFEWDEDKAASNLEKHGIPFPYAIAVFDDPLAIEEPDFESEYGEERWAILGLVQGGELLVVFTTREPKTRIISARKATTDERRTYWKYRALHT